MNRTKTLYVLSCGALLKVNYRFGLSGRPDNDQRGRHNGQYCVSHNAFSFFE
jgi:hypothetical protein